MKKREDHESWRRFPHVGRRAAALSAYLVSVAPSPLAPALAPALSSATGRRDRKDALRIERVVPPPRCVSYKP
eukprot:scaffold98169_cov39-Tisochrysis_lutea.AAC.3